jgi:hypothetical protein
MPTDRHEDSAEFLESFSAENDENHKSDGRIRPLTKEQHDSA